MIKNDETGVLGLWNVGRTTGWFDEISAPAPPQGDAARILIYSHDTFGLGHLRRSRAIANAIVEQLPGASVVILSGSPVIGN
ncbi:hypothetical protein GR304_11920, partial [Microvirga sp. SYSU G3D207]|nr:hypothetical protein [Microvirga arsenatis]NBJ24904.1 hypothetical protein [Microvirga arsenatis]